VSKPVPAMQVWVIDRYGYRYGYGYGYSQKYLQVTRDVHYLHSRIEAGQKSSEAKSDFGCVLWHNITEKLHFEPSGRCFSNVNIHEYDWVNI
jgi:hypothetical protein